MFKSALSALTSTVIGATKNTIDTYRPSNWLKSGGAFERIAQQGIANISYRSPILSDVAQTMLHNFQLDIANKENLKAYSKSDSAKDFKESVSRKMGSDTPNNKIEDEMVRILDKINKSVDNHGIEKAKEDTLFKEYEKYFHEFKTNTKTNTHKENSETTTTDSGLDSGANKLLDLIVSNTQRTFNVLEEMFSRGGMGLGGSVSGSRTTNGQTFIDPMTGMPSISAAVGSIGGSFLAKVFDDETIEKFSQKTKKFFGISPDIEPKKSEVPDIKVPDIEPKKSEVPDIKVPDPDIEPKKSVARPKKSESIRSSIQDILEATSLDLNEDSNKKKIFSLDNTSESAKENITKISSENTSESAKEIEAATNLRASESLKISEEILDELKKLNKTTEENSEVKADDEPKKSDDFTNKIKESVTDRIKTRLPGAGDGLKSASYKIGNIAGKGVGVLRDGLKSVLNSGIVKKIGLPTASTVGYQAGKIVGKGLGMARDGLKSAISTGGELASYIPKAAKTVADTAAPVTNAIGKAASRFALPALGVAAAATGGYMLGKNVINPLIDKGLSAVTGGETSLGSWLYDKTHKDEIASQKKAAPQNIQAAKSTSATQISTLTAAKEKQAEAATTNKSDAPIIVNNSSNTTSGNTPPSIIGGGSVRNTESTFERVQMQDFWSRTP